MTTRFLIDFADATPAQANRNADALERQIGRVAPDVETSRVRDDPNAQDFGATLAIVLGAPAIVALAKGIADWLKLQQTAGTKLKIRREDGSVILEIEDARSGDIRALLESKLGELTGR